MNIFESIKHKSIDELVEWLDKCCYTDYAPWILWWDDNHCRKCEGIFSEGNMWAWCELNDGKCKYFPDKDFMPDSKEIIKMWLESEC